MTLYPCAECGKDVASTARSCPHCGHRLRALIPFWVKVALYVAFIFIFVSSLWHWRCASWVEDELPAAFREHVRRIVKEQHGLELPDDPAADHGWPQVEINAMTNLVTIDLGGNKKLESVFEAAWRWVVGKEVADILEAGLLKDDSGFDRVVEAFAAERTRRRLDVYAMILPYRVRIE